MSDLDDLRAYLDRTGVTYEVSDEQESTDESRARYDDAMRQPPGSAERRALLDEALALERPTGRRWIEVRADSPNPKNTGYGGFVTSVLFDVDGQLVEWGTWE